MVSEDMLNPLPWVKTQLELDITKIGCRLGRVSCSNPCQLNPSAPAERASIAPENQVPGYPGRFDRQNHVPRIVSHPITGQSTPPVDVTRFFMNEPAITPELVARHNLTPDEYERVLQILGRETS